MRRNKFLTSSKMFRVLFSFIVVVKSQLVTVELSMGTIIGEKHKGYDTFFGIPYARVDPACPFGVSTTLPSVFERILKDKQMNSKDLIYKYFYYYF